MAESNVKVANSTLEVEQKVESVQDATVEHISTATPVAEEPKVEEPKVEEPKVKEPKVEEPKVEEPKVKEPKVEEPKVEEPKVEEPKVEEPNIQASKSMDVSKSKEPPVTAVTQATLFAPVAEASTLAETSTDLAIMFKEVKYETAKATTESKPEASSTIVESKSMDTSIKSDQQTFFQKIKKTISKEFLKKSKQLPSEEASLPVSEAPLASAPIAKAPAPTETPAFTFASIATTKTPSPAPEAPTSTAIEAKPSVAKKASRKAIAGNGFFNKVKKSFFKKNHSLIGVMKLGVTSLVPVASIPKASKETESVIPPTLVALEPFAPATPKPAAAQATPLVFAAAEEPKETV